MTARRHQKFINKVKQSLAVEVSFWKETFLENADSVINDVKAAKAESGMRYDVRKMKPESGPF